jgi:pyoverdine/dityrosine biosynthesis protein Dit1
MAPTAIDEYESVGKALLAEKIDSHLAGKEPLSFVMLGFPFKSTNTRDKVLGHLPDMAEQATLNNFQVFNQEIKKVYEPGVSITIVSDNYIFNDLLEVPDRVVQEYKEISMDMGRSAPMTWYDLQDFYWGHNVNTKREKVVSQFGVSAAKMEQDILQNPDVNFLYRGMMVFMEEELAMKPYNSNNQLHKAAKKLAREMMFRNEAYSNLVRAEFPRHIRLSMHPSVNNGSKYSFKLIPGEHSRHSAWHSCLVVKDGELMTMHKKDAIQAGYSLKHKDNRPFYFEA